MNLPEGINQNSACFLLAMRDYYDDPAWEHPVVLDAMRKRVTRDTITGAIKGGGMPYDISRTFLLNEGFKFIEHAYNVDGNPDIFAAMFNDGQEGYIPRRARCLLSFENRGGGYHIACMPYNVARDMMGATKWRLAAIHGSDIL